MSLIRHALRPCLLLCALLASAPSMPQLPPPPSHNLTPPRAEVRLRKLHLVRPDLILYPLAYEVVC